jgi:hypothetical protein
MSMSAILRTSDTGYVGNLGDYLLDGGALAWRPFGMQSCVAGQFMADGTVFVISHFAPQTITEGVRLMVEVLTTRMPMVFAIPDGIAAQADRIGFRRVGTVVQPFFGEPVRKNVMANLATKEEHIVALLKAYAEMHEDGPGAEDEPDDLCEKPGP